ncbi:MAG: ribosome recycling factor [Candidatus Aminicenantes bacterium]|nr:ribosome recycling factor [Candidatus Aminicenantes bacterium]
MESVFKEAKKKMEASLEHFKKEISKLRTGRASAAIFEEIKVEYYGAPTPITQLATINIINPELVIIQPWDKNVVAEIEKAIIRSNLGLNPVNEGTQLKIPIPPLDEERRKDLVKLLHKILEETKAAIRNIRRDAREKLKEMEENKEISEDDKFRGFDKIQELHDEFIKKAEELAKKKEEDILQV